MSKRRVRHEAIEKLPFHLRAEIAENLYRKDLTPSEIDAMRSRCEVILRKHARERQAKAGPKRGKGRKRTGSGQVTGTGGEVRDTIGSFFDISGRTLDRIAAVVDAAEKDPKLGSLVEEMDRTGHVNGVHRKLIVARQAAAISARPPPLPKGPYDVLVVDPPWRFEGPGPGDKVAPPYATMSLDEIARLPVPTLAAKNAVVFLWVTNTHLPHAFGVVAGWGFTYKTLLTWDKERIGAGSWLRGRTEHVLFCVRGKPVVTLSNQTTLLRAKAGRHSVKPDEFYALVESLCPGSKLDMFARKPRPGWTVWGAEVSKA